MPGQAVVTIGARYWAVSLATTFEELTQGLGGVASIPAGTGMLFDMRSDQVATVTTEPMLFPLDIVFIHSSQGVVGVARGVQPGFLVTSDAPARFFLEVNAGEAEGVQAEVSVLIEPLEAVAVEDGGVASIVNFGVAIGTLALVMGMMRPMVRLALPRPERPALAPAVVGPRERRQAPEGLEYFADSAEQLLASTNPYRAQTDAAFREAIERIRAGREVPHTARGMSR